jgi:hypothetical protein
MKNKIIDTVTDKPCKIIKFLFEPGIGMLKVRLSGGGTDRRKISQLKLVQVKK